MQTQTYKRFPARYFSGADVKIYIGDQWVEDIVNLEFSLSEQVAPIFGYASYTFDKVARGARTIQGSFDIAYTEEYYLHNAIKSTIKPTMTGTDYATNKLDTGDVSFEDLMKQRGSNFDKLASELEKKIWSTGGEKSSTYKEKEKRQEPHFHTYDDDKNNKLKEDGFNIIIDYGNDPRAMKCLPNGFIPGTVQTLINTQITGVSKVIGGDGSPVFERYTFIAKDLNGVSL